MAITRKGVGWSLAGGLFIGTAIVFATDSGDHWPALAFWIWIASDFPTARRHAILSGAGMMVVPLGAFVWLWVQGVLPDARVALVDYNLAYLAVGNEGLIGTLDRFAHEVWRRMKTDEVWAVGTLSAVVAVFRWREWQSTRAAGLPRWGRCGCRPRWWRSWRTGRAFSRLTSYLRWCPCRCCSRGCSIGRSHPGSAGESRAASWLSLAAGMVVRSSSVNRGIRMTSWDARHLAGGIDRQTYLRRFQSRDGPRFPLPTMPTWPIRAFAH